MSLAGAQTKLAVAVFENTITLPLRGAGSTHILKPESERLYATVENELLCMHLGANVGLPMASTTMGVANGRRYLLVERYDRHVLDARKVRRGHQEDLPGTWSVSNADMRHDEARMANLFGIIDQHVRRRARDRLTLLDQVIFGCCIGDTDRHGKSSRSC